MNKMAAAPTNFVLLNEEEFAELLDSADSSGTKRQIHYAIRRMEAFAHFTGTDLATVQQYDCAELDRFLSRFYCGLRKDTGELYTKKSMHAIRYGLRRHFQATMDVDILKTNLFKLSNKTYKAMLVKLKQSGKVPVKYKNPVSKEDMGKILDSLDITTPEGLQNKVFIDIMMYIPNCGRGSLRSMSISDFDVKVDEQNQRYIVHRDTMTKSRNKDENCSGHMYEIPGSSRCPVASFLALKEVLNPGEQCMWQRPKPKTPVGLTGSPWYINAPLGINTLGDKMRKISEEAGCSQKYTNYSLRATNCTVLKEACIPSRQIRPMSVTGHHSGSSSKHSSHTSAKKKKLMNRDLANQMSENVPEVQSNADTTLSHNPRPSSRVDNMSSDSGIKRVGLAIFGLGRAGQIHLNNILRVRKADLKWIIEDNLVHAQEIAKKNLIDTSVQIIKPGDSDKVFSDPSVKAIVICTPTNYHEDLVRRGLKSGKAVFCEKPIADTVEDTEACYIDAEVHGMPLLCAFNRRFDPSVRLMKERMNRGDIGQVQSIKTCSRDSPFPPVEYLRISGGIFHDCGVHDIDAICWILGEDPVSVFTQAHAFHKEIAELDDVDQVIIVMKFPSGCIASIDLSRHAVYGYDQRIEIFGSKGMLEQQNRPPTSVVHHSEIGATQDPIETSFPQRYREAYEMELTHFLNVVLGIEKEILVKKEDTLRVCEIAAACEESYRTGKQVFMNAWKK